MIKQPNPVLGLNGPGSFIPESEIKTKSKSKKP